MTTTPLVTIHQAAATVAAYESAVRLGVLDWIDNQPARADQVAAGCGISNRGAEALLHVLTSLGMLSRDEHDMYRPTVGRLASLQPTLEPWQHLADVVSDGEATKSVDRRHYPDIVPHLDGVAPDAAKRVAQLLPAARRILDIGAGAAPWSRALAARDRLTKVTAVDLAPVLKVTAEAVHGAGLETQFDLLPADVFTADLPPSRYDLVVLGHFCHLFSAATNRALLARLAPTLRPAGTLAIIDVPPGTTSTHALYELSLFLRTKSGRLHSLNDYTDWLTEVGLEPTPASKFDGQVPLVLISGHSTRDQRKA
jgi:SAM-dependent methyltransferase